MRVLLHCGWQQLLITQAAVAAGAKWMAQATGSSMVRGGSGQQQQWLGMLQYMQLHAGCQTQHFSSAALCAFLRLQLYHCIVFLSAYCD
jgi:hypothetical protein